MSQSADPVGPAGWAGEWLPPCLAAGDPPARQAPGNQAPGRERAPDAASGPDGSATFAGPAEAMAAVEAGLAFLARAGLAELSAGTMAECLRGYGRAEAVLASGRSRLLSAFSAQRGCEADGHPTAKSWLRWQTRSTGAAAGVQVWWMRRLAEHSRVAAALTAGEVSLSWARLLCEWSGKLPPGARDEADKILLEAIANGADLPELSRIAEHLHAATAVPGPAPGGGEPDAEDDAAFTGRRVWLDLHWKGAGRLTGDLTPECAAALTAALDSLGKRAGPEDDRSQGQRNHDALEELCRLAMRSGDLPDVAGQPAQVLLHVTLDQLRNLPGAALAAAAWAASGAGPGWLRSAAAAQGYACDARIMPVVTGHLDAAVLARLAGQVRAMTRPGGPGGPGGTVPSDALPGALPADALPGGVLPRGVLPEGVPSGDVSPGDMLTAGTLLRWVVDLLSGPAGLAAALRASSAGPHAAGISLPLDVGAATATIPPHLRRAVTVRDRHCAWPGCSRPPPRCQVHHVKPRSEGGATALHNLVLLCSYHHLIAIHRDGWALTLHADGTTTAVSPDRRRVCRSHGPPPARAA